MIRCVRIVAPHFVAGIELSGEFCISAAPILHYMVGWSIIDIVKYCNMKQWYFESMHGV